MRKLLGVVLVVVLWGSQLGLVVQGSYFLRGTYYEVLTPEEIWQQEQEAIVAQWFNMVPESNNIANWPQGPLIHARGAIVMEVDTGVVLYAKNAHETMYPASISKLLTLLIALENSGFTDQVEFSQASMAMVRWDYANIAMQQGEIISMEDALFALLLASANEVAFAIGETVGDLVDGGGLDSFARLMNEKSQEIGTLNSSWSNPTGLHDDNHYTTAYDMALIVSYLYHYPEYRLFMSELDHEIGYTNKVEEVRTLWQDHQMLNNPVNYFYNPLANGGKTGFTDQAGTTLVTTANNGEFSIVVVLLHAHGWEAYNATNALFDYAFNNFSRFHLDERALDQHVIEIIEPAAYLMLPNHVTFSEVTREIILNEGESNQGMARYTYNGQLVGEALVRVSDEYLEYLAHQEYLAYQEYLAHLEYLENLRIEQEALDAQNQGTRLTGDGESTGSLRNALIIILAIVLVAIIIAFALRLQQVKMKREKKERERRKEKNRRVFER
jgi:D-alanyl-D-alanine carboxypeptidase